MEPPMDLCISICIQLHHLAWGGSNKPVSLSIQVA